MSLFEGIGFENFKVFGKETYFEFAPITILTGTNNSGKSSLLNGIKLLQENFKHVKKSFTPIEEINLENIITTNIDAGSMSQRYGTLQQFIFKNSNRNEFNFSFRRKMESIEDEVEIKFKVRINDNNFKNGIVIQINVRSIKSNKTIFEITEINTTTNNNNDDGVLKKSSAGNKINLDFNFFFTETMTRIENSNKYFKKIQRIQTKLEEVNDNLLSNTIVAELLKDFNSTYGTRYSLSSDEEILKLYYFYQDPPFVINLDTISKINKEQEKTQGVYDFSFLWNEDLNNKALFEKIILSFYGTSFIEASSKFNNDILKFLSDVDWTFNHDRDFFGLGINFMLQKTKETNGIGLKKFIELFTNYSRLPGQMGRLGTPDIVKIQEDYIQSAIIKNRNFYEKVFEPLLFLLSSNFTRDERLNLKADENTDINPFDKMLPSYTERTLSQLIRECINLIPSCIAELNEVNFLPTNKVQNKRTYSFADNDDFTLLVKKLEGLEPEYRNRAYRFINRWLKEFEIADALCIQHDTDTSNFKPYLKTKFGDILLADFGFGTSQLIPLLLKIIPEVSSEFEILGDPEAPAYQSRVIVLEEPETNLHPALQSKLADLFVEANKHYSIQIIVETHSEYLIRKLQYLTGKGEIDPSMSQLYYFHHPDKIPEGEEQAKKININRDGSLTDNFGKGFFDEADNIALELFLINQSQKN